MKKKQLLFLFFLVNYYSTSVFAISASEFIKKCDSVYLSPSQETPQQAVNRALAAGSCSGFVGGVINGVTLVGNLLGQKKLIPQNFICLPPNKQANQLLNDSIDYMKKNNKIANQPAQLGIYNAMAIAYPCKAKN